MKIKEIHIENVLSYIDETIKFNNDLNIFVGANGTGKSNLINIVIYTLKKYCFKNFEINRSFGMDRIGYAKYSIREKNPLYNSSENFFLKKHKQKEKEKSNIEFKIKFEKIDIDNLNEIKRYKNEINNFLTNMIDNISFMDDPYSVSKEEIVEFFDVQKKDLKIGKEIAIKIIEQNGIWKIENPELKLFKYMKYFSLMSNILNLIEVNHNVKTPFTFFEAYRNNAKETTIVGISDFQNQSYINTQTIANMSSLAYSIGNNSTYIMLATKKYGLLHRKYIQEEGGYQKFYNLPEYVKMKQYFKKFNYDIEIECIEPNNNTYQFYLIKDGLKMEIDTISSGEREIINFIFGLFMEKFQDGIVIIDEPELHLHPSWQKKLVQILKEETQDKNVQIMFVTHSTSFINYSLLNNIFRIYKKEGESKCIKINDFLKENNKDNRKKLKVINETNNEKIFFAKAVILVEGITDEILLRKIYKSEFDNEEEIEFVNINGKANYKNFSEILEKIGVQYFFIGDYDNLFDFSEMKSFFNTDKEKQNKDLIKKNKSYSCLELLKAISNYINIHNKRNFKILKDSYAEYEVRFLKKKECLTLEEENSIKKFIEKQYDNNFYILSKGELEDYLDNEIKNKAKNFERIIEIVTDENEYNKFKKNEGFKEIRDILNNINNKIIKA